VVGFLAVETGRPNAAEDVHRSISSCSSPSPRSSDAIESGSRYAFLGLLSKCIVSWMLSHSSSGNITTGHGEVLPKLGVGHHARLILPHPYHQRYVTSRAVNVASRFPRRRAVAIVRPQRERKRA
jgi:hypothetical protein